MKQPEALRLIEWIENDMSCDGDAAIVAELRRLHKVNQMLLEALTMIENWSSHTTEFSVDFGSNGVRDFYRAIARAAISKGKQA